MDPDAVVASKALFQVPPKELSDSSHFLFFLRGSSQPLLRFPGTIRGSGFASILGVCCLSENALPCSRGNVKFQVVRISFQPVYGVAIELFFSLWVPSLFKASPRYIQVGGFAKIYVEPRISFSERKA